VKELTKQVSRGRSFQAKERECLELRPSDGNILGSGEKEANEAGAE